MDDAAKPASAIRVLALFGGVVKYGAERGNLEMLSALRAQGAEVLLLVSDAPWAADIRRDLAADGFQLQPCPYLVLPRPDYQINPLVRFPPVLIRATLTFLAAVRRFRPTHIQAGSQLHVFTVLPGLLLDRTPLIYRCGDKPIRHNRLWSGLWRFISWRSRWVVANSRFVAESLKAAGTPADRIRLIYNRPRPTSRASDAPAVEAQAFNVVFAGQINPTKGPHLLIEAFRRVVADYPQARLWIVGRISEWEGDAWARQLRDETLADPQLGSRVRFPGFVEDVPGLLARCDLAVVPTVTEEPLGGVALEAKAAGTACMVFPSGGLPELVEHDVDGYLCKDSSVDALEAGLRAYLADPARAAEHGRAAAASLSRFGVGDFSRRWLEVFATDEPRKERADQGG